MRDIRRVHGGANAPPQAGNAAARRWQAYAGMDAPPQERGKKRAVFFAGERRRRCVAAEGRRGRAVSTGIWCANAPPQAGNEAA